MVSRQPVQHLRQLTVAKINLPNAPANFLRRVLLS
jgi:hypothetical protein